MKVFAAFVAFSIAGFCFAADSKSLDIKFMLRGYCYAGSVPDPKAPGGYATSDNKPKKIAGGSIGQQGQLALVALPGEFVAFGQASKGFRLLLVNRTKTEVALRACDSRLSIIQEAMDTDGRWRPIEYLPSSWCGNSYHRVFLPRNAFWEFAAPCYSGGYKTKLRFVLQGDQPLYSSEFEGAINLEQFTQKQGHQPTDIMDPYLE